MINPDWRSSIPTGTCRGLLSSCETADPSRAGRGARWGLTGKVLPAIVLWKPNCVAPNKFGDCRIFGNHRGPRTTYWMITDAADREQKQPPCSAGQTQIVSSGLRREMLNKTKYAFGSVLLITIFVTVQLWRCPCRCGRPLLVLGSPMQ